MPIEVPLKEKYADAGKAKKTHPPKENQGGVGRAARRAKRSTMPKQGKGPYEPPESRPAKVITPKAAKEGR